MTATRTEVAAVENVFVMMVGVVMIVLFGIRRLNQGLSNQDICRLSNGDIIMWICLMVPMD